MTSVVHHILADMPKELHVPTETQARTWQHQHNATWLAPITETPQALWLTCPEHAGTIAREAVLAHLNNKLLVVVGYHLPNLDGCGGGAKDAKAYREFIATLAGAVSSTRCLIILEPDSIALDHFDAERAALLADATKTLTSQGHWVFLDAGHSRWHSVESITPRLIESGISDATGFSLNIANRMDDASLGHYGQNLSAAVNHKPFITDSGRNGCGPHLTSDGGVIWCNAAGEGLGRPPALAPQPPSDPAHLANLWIKCPGESDGYAEEPPSYASSPAGVFSPRIAATLIHNSPYIGQSTKNTTPAAQTLAVH